MNPVILPDFSNTSHLGGLFKTFTSKVLQQNTMALVCLVETQHPLKVLKLAHSIAFYKHQARPGSVIQGPLNRYPGNTDELQRFII